MIHRLDSACGTANPVSNHQGTPMSTSNQTMSPAAKIFVGLLQCIAGFCLALPAGALRVFPITSPLGAVLLKPAISLCYIGGGNFGSGVVGCFSGGDAPIHQVNEAPKTNLQDYQVGRGSAVSHDR